MFRQVAEKSQNIDVAQRKTKIQNDLKARLGILVDAPTQGSGNTDDGNTARKFFDNIDVVSSVTGKHVTENQ